LFKKLVQMSKKGFVNEEVKALHNNKSMVTVLLYEINVIVLKQIWLLIHMLLMQLYINQYNITSHMFYYD